MKSNGKEIQKSIGGKGEISINKGKLDYERGGWFSLQDHTGTIQVKRGMCRVESLKESLNYAYSQEIYHTHHIRGCMVKKFMYYISFLTYFPTGKELYYNRKKREKIIRDGSLICREMKAKSKEDMGKSDHTPFLHTCRVYFRRMRNILTFHNIHFPYMACKGPVGSCMVPVGRYEIRGMLGGIK